MKIAEACEKSEVIMAVCHVLRYFPPVLKIREIIDQGLIGEVVTIDHRENILWWHFAHSFVRGNWRNVATSTFSLLAKVQSMSLKRDMAKFSGLSCHGLWGPLFCFALRGQSYSHL